MSRRIDIDIGIEIHLYIVRVYGWFIEVVTADQIGMLEARGVPLHQRLALVWHLGSACVRARCIWLRLSWHIYAGGGPPSLFQLMACPIGTFVIVPMPARSDRQLLLSERTVHLSRSLNAPSSPGTPIPRTPRASQTRTSSSAWIPRLPMMISLYRFGFWPCLRTGSTCGL